MKSLLVKIASFAVMVHMTFGCSMHHGLGNNACAHQHETTSKHDGDSCHHEGHDHENHQHHGGERPLDTESTDDVDNTNHRSHTGCCDDDCNATQSVQFKIASLNFSVPYFGGDILALVESQNTKTYAGFVVDPAPDSWVNGTGVRAHLLLGVQIL